MNTSSSTRNFFFVSFATIFLLLLACQPSALKKGGQPTATQGILVTQTATQPSSGMMADISLDYSAVAKNVIVETMPAQPISTGRPDWEATPQYIRLTLQNYIITEHTLKPQIYIYPVGDLAIGNLNAGKIASDLLALLQTQRAGDQMPFLPQLNAMQVMHAQVQYLDFKNGKVVRFLTQFDQSPLPINNNELIYTFQGLTSDGRFYIAAILPVTNPELPSGSEVSELQSKAQIDFPDYLSRMVTLLNQKPADSFTPDLNQLDGMIRSMDVK